MGLYDIPVSEKEQILAAGKAAMKKDMVDKALSSVAPALQQAGYNRAMQEFQSAFMADAIARQRENQLVYGMQGEPVTNADYQQAVAANNARLQAERDRAIEKEYYNNGLAGYVAPKQDVEAGFR